MGRALDLGVLASPLTSCATLWESCHHDKPQFPHVENGNTQHACLWDSVKPKLANKCDSPGSETVCKCPVWLCLVAEPRVLSLFCLHSLPALSTTWHFQAVFALKRKLPTGYLSFPRKSSDLANNAPKLHLLCPSWSFHKIRIMIHLTELL